MNPQIYTLRKDAAELRSILLDGKVEQKGEDWIAVPREMVLHSFDSLETDSIIFELTRAQEWSRPPLFQIWFKAIRPASLTATFTPALVILCYGLFRGWSFDGVSVVLALLASLCLQIAMNAFNDVEDHLRFIDLPGTFRGSGVIQKGWVSARKMRSVGYYALVLGCLLGLPAVLGNFQILFWVGGLSAFGVLAYSNQPLGIKYRSLGDIVVFLLAGPLFTIGFSEAIYSQFDRSVIFFGFTFGFLTWGIYHSSHLHHFKADYSRRLSHHTSTLALTIGFKKSRHLCVLLFLMAYTSLFFGSVFGEIPFLVSATSLLAVPWIGRFVRRVYKASGPASALLGNIRWDPTLIHFFIGVFCSFGFLLNLLLKI